VSRALRVAVAALAALALAACTPDHGAAPAPPGRPSSAALSAPGSPSPPLVLTPTPSPAPSFPPTTSVPSPTGPELDTWQVGAHPLPLRPDGYGVMLPTPRQLRVRRMPTRDVLPPPPHGRFAATIAAVTPAIRRRMGQSWSPRCPVGLDGLRYVTVSFRGFDGRAHTGELVVNASVARDVVQVFRTLYAARFPIEEMRLPTTADLTAPPTGDGNDTAALVCRATRGQTTWSAHAYGLAIDLNPFMNPYHKGDCPRSVARRGTRSPGCVVLPELASSYLDRSWRRPGMVLPGGVATRAFAAVGWTWGGDFHSLKDLMHFSETGR
jgi:hypothetical protein